MKPGHPGSDGFHTRPNGGAGRRREAPSPTPTGMVNDPLILTNGLIVTRDRAFIGTVEVMKQHIVAVYRGPTALPGAIDLSGDYLLPGLIELNTRNLRRHLAFGSSLHATVLSAVLTHDAEIISAGITTAFDRLCCGDDGENAHSQMISDLVAVIRHAAQQGLIRSDHHLARDFVIDDDASEFGRSTAHSASGETDEHPPDSVATSPSTTSPVERAVHSVTVKRTSHAIYGFPRSLALAQAARAARLKVMVAAPSLIGECAEGVPLVESHESALLIAAEKLVDILSSDDYPPSLLQGAFRLRQSPSRMTLSEAIATVSSTPAQVAGLTDRGEIAPGKRADLIRVCFVEALPVMRGAWRAGVQVY